MFSCVGEINRIPYVFNQHSLVPNTERIQSAKILPEVFTQLVKMSDRARAGNTAAERVEGASEKKYM